MNKPVLAALALALLSFPSQAEDTSGKDRTDEYSGNDFDRAIRGNNATFAEVVNHYDAHLNTGLTDAEKADLVEYLNSL